MPVHRLDHVNLRTARVAEMVAFYERILGATAGDRPPFPFGGAWLYVGGRPAIHLVEVPRAPETADPRIEHFAFEADGLAPFLERLTADNVAFRLRRLPGGGVVQVGFRDPDDNHLHVDFPEAEYDAMEAAGDPVPG